MPRKIYEAPYSIISNICVFVENKPRRVSFSPVSQYEGSHTGMGSMFETEDVSLQEALESSPLFGRSFRVFKTEMTETDCKENAKNDSEDSVRIGDNETVVYDIVDTDEVATLNDARDYLETHFGIEKSKLPTTKAIMNAAQRNGICFKALANK